MRPAEELAPPEGRRRGFNDSSSHSRQRRKFCRRNRRKSVVVRGPPRLLLLLLLTFHPANVLSLSILVIGGASASASAPRQAGPTTRVVVATRASLRDYDDAGAALVEAQDSLSASFPSSSLSLSPDFGGGATASSGGNAPPPSPMQQQPWHSNQKPPLFSLRNWFAPRPTLVSALARGGTVPPLGMAISSTTSAGASTVRIGSCGGSASVAEGSLAATTAAAAATAVLCTQSSPLPPELAESALRAAEKRLGEPTVGRPSALEAVGSHLAPSPPAPTPEAAPAEDAPLPESVHLKLTGLAEPSPPNPEQASSQPGNNQTSLIRVHSFVYEGKTYVALNTPKHKFVSYLSYLNIPVGTTSGHAVDGGTGAAAAARSASRIQTRRVAYDSEVRQEWRELWKNRQLLTDRTELLAVYPSDSDGTRTAGKTPVAAESAAAAAAPAGRNGGDGASTDSSESPPPQAPTKRGGFADLLYLYTERFAAMLADEQRQHPPPRSSIDGSSGATAASIRLLSWMRDNYGVEGTRQLQSDAFRGLAEAEQVRRLQHFLEWFRGHFPYYYDRCGSCGASMKDDMATFQANNNDHHDNSPVAPHAAPDDASVADANFASATAAIDTVSNKDAGVVPKAKDDDADDDDDDDDVEEPSEYQTFIGYIYPSDEELEGKASRTELYRCHVCHEYTRFPRFNSAWHVLEHRRGRCGEYSMLLYRFLCALGHPSRWVVDWSDHVWAEIRLGGRWVHLDPCEAAVDQNLLYQGWGKKQTYILGFAAATFGGCSADDDDAPTPLVEDITSTYTSDAWESICQRRDESEAVIRASIDKAIVDLASKLPTPSLKAEPVRL